MMGYVELPLLINYSMSLEKILSSQDASDWLIGWKVLVVAQQEVN